MEGILKKEFNDYVVIGLGRFGMSLAVTLADEGKNVLAIDSDKQYVEAVQNKVTHAVVADATKKDVLHSLGVQNFDCAIVCIGEDLSASMLATLNCQELKVPYIIAKSQSDQQKDILEKIGVDLVVFPEVYMSKKLSSALLDPLTNEIVKLTDNYKIVEIMCPTNWVGRSISEINIRKKYGVNVIFIKRDGNIIEPFPEAVLEKTDSLVISGTPKNIEVVENKIDDVVNLKDRFTDAISEE